MKPLRHILVGIKDTGSRSQPALRKAAHLAEASGARLTLFHALCSPLYLDALDTSGTSPKQLQQQWRERALQQLEKLAAPIRKAGVTVSVASQWDFPAFEAIIRQARRGRADLIVAERHATRHLLPSLLRFNDWELLRRSPVPVLLVKHRGAWRKPSILAAIDPSHGFAKPTKLDAAIMKNGQVLAEALGGKLHIAHAWPAEMPVTLLQPPLAVPVPASSDYKRLRQRRRALFNREIDKAGLPAAKRHFVAGHPVEVIPKLVRRQRTGIVVMGAVSRSGLQRLVIGNVAEQVLDSLTCDVLIVKPASFRSKVGKQARGAQILPAPPYV